MTDQQLIEQERAARPDLVALIEAMVRECMHKWAEARRDGLMREKAHIEKHILHKQEQV